MIAALIAALMAAIGFMFSGGHGGNHQGQQNSKVTNPSTDKTSAFVANNSLSKAPEPKQAVAVPTPALLPGLIGLGVATLRKRKAEKDEANV